MERRSAGEGHIEELPSKRFRVRLTVNGKRRTLGIFDTEPEARALLDAARAKIAAGQARPADGNTLSEVGQRLFSEMAVAGRSGVKSVRYSWDKWVESSELARMNVASIRRADVRNWHRGLVVAGLKASTAKLILTYVKQALELAVEEGLIPSNPARFKQTRVRKVEPSWTYLTPEEQVALTTCPEIPAHDRAIIKVLLGTGLRIGELADLQDVDLITSGPNPRIIVRQSKTGVPRVVALGGLGLVGAREWRALRDGYCKANPRGLAFPSRQGCRRDRHKPFGWTINGQPRWRTYLARAGIARAVRIHDLRHTFASSLVAGWHGKVWSLDRVREILGHTSVSMTLRYAHLSPTVLAEEVSLLNPTLSPRAIENACVESEKATASTARAWSGAEASRGPETLADDGSWAGHGPRESAQALLDALRNKSQDWPRLAARLIAAVENAHPLLSLVSRFRDGGPHAASYATDIARVVLESSTSPATSRRGGAR